VGVDNTDWWSVDKWNDYMRDLSPLAIDTTIHWDTLEICVGFLCDTTDLPPHSLGLQVDDITIVAHTGEHFDLGVTAVQLPSPNANDISLFMDTVAVTNFGLETAHIWDYGIVMGIQDSSGAFVFGPTFVASFAPQIDPGSTKKVPVDTTICNWTLTEEGNYQFLIWTFWPPDTNTVNDTLKTWWSSKDHTYPGVYNYPAGCGELRRHDRGFYTYPQIERRDMSAGDIAAVHFTPSERFCPFDLRYVRPGMADSAIICTLTVWGSGSLPDEAPLLAAAGFDPAAGDSVDLSAIEALQDLCSDFWIGIKFPTGCGAIMGMEMEESEPEEYPGRCWGRSYLKTDTTGWEWPPLEYDWLITTGIAWRTVDPQISLTDGSLHFDWTDVSQAGRYFIYRQNEPSAAVPALFDSTAVSEYTDSGAAGDTAVHYYYRFRTAHQDGISYDRLSREVGEFDRSLENGP
jgi:hypothetical protein